MARRYRSKISAAVHEAMNDLNKVGLVDKKTMGRFDAACLTETHKRSTTPKGKKAAARRRQTRRV